MTTVLLNASMAKNAQEIIDWLNTNVGKLHGAVHTRADRLTHYHGDGWEARWRQYGAGWFMDVIFDDPFHATFFTLRWK